MLVPRFDVSNDPQLAKLVQQANASQSAIGLTLHGEERAVLLSAKAFRHLLGLQTAEQQDQTSWEEFSQQFQAAIVETEHNTREKLLNLVQAVKQELAAEREQRLAHEQNDVEST